MSKIKKKIEEQVLDQMGILFIKPHSMLVKKEEKKKSKRMEKNFRNLVEISKNNPRFFEEVKSHSIQREVWKALSNENGF